MNGSQLMCQQHITLEQFTGLLPNSEQHEINFYYSAHLMSVRSSVESSGSFNVAWWNLGKRQYHVEKLFENFVFSVESIDKVVISFT